MLAGVPVLTSSILARLGLVLQGSNANLEMLPPEDEDKTSSDPEDEEDSEDEEDEDDSEGGEGEEDSSGGSASSEEDDEEGDGGEDPDDEEDSNHGQDDPLTQDEGEAPDGESDPDGGEEGDEESSEGEGGNGAGGLSPAEQQEAIDLAAALLSAMEKGLDTGLISNNEALSNALKTEGRKDILKNEIPWRPLNPDLDKVSSPPNADQAAATALLQSVKTEVAFLANQLRSKYLSARADKVTHGVKHGRDLSERRLVETVIEIRSGRPPTRPDWIRTPRDACTLAVGIVLDESGSMDTLRTLVARAALAIAAPLDSLGSPCLVVGPRDGTKGSGSWPDLGSGGQAAFHRVNGIVIDIFKHWDEPLNMCLRRFPNVKAFGGTPLEDGIQYAMQELSKRPERHRVILVLTDGAPNCPKVCTRQIRLAAEARIDIIGVALDEDSADLVAALFPKHVKTGSISQLPNKLLAVLDGIIFPKAGGKKILLDSALTAKKNR